MKMHPNPLSWLTTLSLDAPLVAVIWQEFLARRLGTETEPHHRILIFAAVWLGYAADRWFDTWRYQEVASLRHRFHCKYRWPVFYIWILTLLSSLIFAVRNLSQQELISGLGVAGLSIGLTILIQKGKAGQYHTLFKSCVASFLILASLLLFNVPSAAADLSASVPTGLSLFSLFLTNCLLIHNWDQEQDRQQGEHSVQSTTLLQRQLLISKLVSFSLILIAVSTTGSLAFPASISLLLLFLLSVLSERIKLDTRRTLADLCLLSPIPFLAW